MIYFFIKSCCIDAEVANTIAPSLLKIKITLKPQPKFIHFKESLSGAYKTKALDPKLLNLLGRKTR